MKKDIKKLKLKNEKSFVGIFEGKRMQVNEHDEEMDPRILYINTTDVCNEKCVFCVVKSEQDNFGTLSEKEAKRIIKEFSKGGNKKTLVFSGGEPTIWEPLVEIVNYINDFSVIDNISIITNGVRMEDTSFFNKLISADINRKLGFCFSLHSHKEEISERLTRSRGTFKKTIKGIENAISKGRASSIYQVITSENYKDIPEFCHFLNTNYPEIKHVTFAYPYPRGEAVLNVWIYVKMSLLRPYLVEGLKFLEERGYSVDIANCGQLPLCIIPGFESKILSTLSFTKENVLGSVGEKAFHDCEFSSSNWVDSYKGKGDDCKQCILDKYCQGFWKTFLGLFEFDGIQPVNKNNFKGNKVKSIFFDTKDIETIMNQLSNQKINLVSVRNNYDPKALLMLIKRAQKERTFIIVISKDRVIYPS